MKRIKGSNTFASDCIDVFITIGMFAIYKSNMILNEEPPDNRQPLLRCFGKQYQTTDQVQDTRENKKIRELVYEESIYNMALVTLLDPCIIESWGDKYKNSKSWKGYFLSRLPINEKDSDGVFFGMCIVIGIQFLTIYLIMNEFVLGLNSIPVKNYWILIPRTISSFYMHSALTGEIKSGLAIMKYVANHPHYFKRRDLERDDSELTSEEDGWYIRLTYAYMIGLIQYSTTMVIEFMTIIFLNSLGSYLFILICYAALSGIASFDNMYAHAMSHDHPIKKGLGKRLGIQFYRYMHFRNADDAMAQ